MVDIVRRGMRRRDLVRGGRVAEPCSWGLSVMEQRYHPVMEVLSGSPVTEVAGRYGVTRQAVHNCPARHRKEGLAGAGGSFSAAALPATPTGRIYRGADPASCAVRPRDGGATACLRPGEGGRVASAIPLHHLPVLVQC
jgi:hypothetical protein